MSKTHPEDERYKNFYDRTPHGEVPSDERVRLARDGGTDPLDAETEAEAEVGAAAPVQPTGRGSLAN